MSNAKGNAEGSAEVNTESSAVMPTYNRIPLDFVKGEGSYLIDSEGNRFLDAISGIGVCALGHNHPQFIQAITQQVALLTHTSNLYNIPLQSQLAERLCQASGMENVFFCNSGAESNEAAIKLARMNGHNKGIELPTILVMEGAFHGRTMGALTATHNNKHQAGFGPLLDGFVRVPYDDINAVKQALEAHTNIVAVLLEPIQGEGGVILPQANYLAELRKVCNQHDILMMLDEVQTGNGRTGQYFAYQHSDILPDILTTAKGLGNGYPMGACLTNAKASNIFQAGHHATTFGGSPLACAAGIAVNKAIIAENLLENASEMGAKIVNALKQQLKDCSVVVDIRGIGLMIGIELNQPCPSLLESARNQGLLINIAAGNVVRLLPSLNLTETDANTMVEVVSNIIREFSHEC